MTNGGWESLITASAAVFQHDLSKLKTAVEYILDCKPDLAVCTGDLTSSGQPGEFERVKEILKPLIDSDVPLVYTPGNHDCYVRRPWCVRAMKETVFEVNQKRFTFDDMPMPDLRVSLSE